MKPNEPHRQGELFGLIWQPRQFPFRLRVNDLVCINGQVGLIIRVSECAAVVLVNQQTREFCTRFDKPVRFQPPPARFRISANAEVEILYRRSHKPQRKRPAGRPARQLKGNP